MHADICEADDTGAIARLREALRSLGAELSDRDWAIGVDLYRLRVGSQEVTIYSDAWSVDIEGPEELVNRITAAVAAVAFYEAADVKPD